MRVLKRDQHRFCNFDIRALYQVIIPLISFEILNNDFVQIKKIETRHPEAENNDFLLTLNNYR